MRQEICTFDDLVNGIVAGESMLVVSNGNLVIALRVEKIALIDDECRVLRLGLEASNSICIYADDYVITRRKDDRDRYMYRIIDTCSGVYTISGN